jgi:hypothetical protein
MFYAIFALALSPGRYWEPMGYFVFGLALVLFALSFQMTDNKNMELKALELGRQRFEEKETKPEFDFEPSQTKLFVKKTEKLEATRVMKKPKQITTANDLFFRPNKPTSKVNLENDEIPIRTKSKTRSQKKDPTQVKLDDLLKPKPKKKPARKIRRAI